PHVFSHHEIELTRTFANHAAIALENALLFSRTAEQLQEQQRVIESIIQSMSDGLLLHDAGGTVLFANRGLADAIEATPEELEGQPIDRVLARMLPYALEPEVFEYLRAAALAGRSPRTFEFTIKRDHRKRDIRARVFSVIDDDGRAIGQGELYQDITRYREVDRLKSALVSTVSHELRTPLAAIKGYASTLLQDDVEWDTLSVRQFAQAISAEADRLTQLVNDLLDMGRIEAGTLHLNKQVTALREVIESALAQITDNGAHALNLDLPDDLPLLLIDARRIEVVVRNLVENAVKYAPAHTPIDIEARREGDRVRVRVSDQGPGIAPEHRAHIFDRFYRADDTLTRATGGAGLGLAIAREIVRAHGGRISVRSGLGEGTTFDVFLPLIKSRL
ncbi:partial two-component system, OmpR family, sensor histidine kinase VicK, partial [uncultured bacterium]